VGTLPIATSPHHFTIQLYESWLRGTGEARKASKANELDILVSNTYRALMTHVVRERARERREIM